MGLKLRISAMCCMVLAAAFFALEAYRSIRPEEDVLPAEVYAGFQQSRGEAEYFLRPWGDVVAVYSGQRERRPIQVTAIELSNLRSADRALIKRGIPAANSAELLSLLEDLGS